MMFERPDRPGKVLLAALAAVLLAGCQAGADEAHGDHEPVPAFSAEGLWRGELTRGATVHEALAIVLDGEMVIGSAGNGVYDGFYRQVADEVEGALQFAGAGPDGPVDAVLWVSESFLWGDLVHAGAADARADLSFDPAWFRSASLDRLDGHWADLDGLGHGVSIAIDRLGRLFGSATDGCHYSGRVGIPAPGRNVYRMHLSVTSCGSADGDYAGFATLTDSVSRNDTLAAILAGPGGALDWRLRWQ